MVIEKKHIALVAVGLAVVACSGALFIGVPRYKKWQADRLTWAAQAAFQKGEYVDASLKLRHVLDLFPNDPVAHGLLADMSEKAGDPSAVLWRRRLADLSHNDPDALIAYASVATRFNQRVAAKDALAEVPIAERGRASYLAASAALAYSSRVYDDAIVQYKEALRLKPDDLQLQFSLATAQIAVEDYSTREAGRALLRKLSAEPTLALKSRRALITNLSATGEALAALREARALVAVPEHEFNDELIYLKLLQLTEDSQFPVVLADLQRKSEAKMIEARDLLIWMAEGGLPQDGIAWVTVTKPDLAKVSELQPGLAACYVAAEDWARVMEITQGANWGPLEYVRHVYRSRALREKGELSLALSDWKIAATAASSRSESILWLARTAEKWDWPEETEQALWAAVDKSADQDWALETLRVRYVRARDSNGMRRIAGQMMKVAPDNFDAQNNFSNLSLLLGKELERAMRLAREVYLKDRHNPDYVSTYAYSLHVAGDSEAALKVLEADIPEAKLREPAFAAYYGVILQATGRTEQAKTFLEIARRSRLLPEEEHMVNAALAEATNSGELSTPAPPQGATQSASLETARSEKTEP